MACCGKQAGIRTAHIQRYSKTKSRSRSLEAKVCLCQSKKSANLTLLEYSSVKRKYFLTYEKSCAQAKAH